MRKLPNYADFQRPSPRLPRLRQFVRMLYCFVLTIAAFWIASMQFETQLGFGLLVASGLALITLIVEVWQHIRKTSLRNWSKGNRRGR